MTEEIPNLAERLEKASDAILANNYLLCGSKWCKTECEVIVCQTIIACHVNLQKHGEAMSWWANGLWGEGIGRLLKDGSLIREFYQGPISPPEGTRFDDVAKLPVVLRISEHVLLYVESVIAQSKQKEKLKHTNRFEDRNLAIDQLVTGSNFPI